MPSVHYVLLLIDVNTNKLENQKKKMSILISVAVFVQMIPKLSHKKKKKKMIPKLWFVASLLAIFSF